MSRPIRAIAVTLILITAFASPAAAQSTDRIAASLNDTGVYIEPGADGSVQEFRDVIEQLGAAGLILRIASLASDEVNVDGLARDLRDRTGATVLVITPQTLAGASSRFSDTDIGRAIDASLADFDDSVATGALGFGEQLIASATAADAADPAPGSSGSVRGLLIFLFVIAVAIMAVVLFARTKNKKRVEAEIKTRRSVVSEELEAIGIEIVELSDAMSVSDDEEATQHFRKGNADFLDLKDRLSQATSLWQITEVDLEADTTAWHLEAAAALLEDKPIPDKPTPPAFATGVAAVPQPPPTEASPDDSRTSRRAERGRIDSRLDDHRQRSPGPSPGQQSRQQRRESWKPPKVSGGALGGILTNILVGGILGGAGNSRPPRGWSGGGTISSAPRSRSRRSGGSSSRRRGGSASRSRSRSSGGSASRRR